MNSYWERLRTTRITRRRALTATGSTALGSALLIACGGGSDSTLKLDDAGSSREPGTVWFAKNDWKLADETKDAVRGGIYRGVMTADQDGHYRPDYPQSRQPSRSPKHVHEFCMARNRGPGIDPASSRPATHVRALAESWEISTDGLTDHLQDAPGRQVPHRRAGQRPRHGHRRLEDQPGAPPRDRPHRAAMVEVLDEAEFPDAGHMVWKLKVPYAPIFDRIWSDAFRLRDHAEGAERKPDARRANADRHRLQDPRQAPAGHRLSSTARTPTTGAATRSSTAGTHRSSRSTPTATPSSSAATSWTSRPPRATCSCCTRTRLTRSSSPNRSRTTTPAACASAHQPGEAAWNDPRVRIAIRRSIDFKGIATFLSNKQQFEAQAFRSRCGR